MRRSQFSDDEILMLIDEARRGVPIEQICHAAHVSVRTFYRWRRRLEGVTLAGLERMSSLEAENRRLKRQLALAATKSGPRFLKRLPSNPHKVARAEYGMDWSFSPIIEPSSEPAIAETNGRVTGHRIATGALTGRFAHLRSGASGR